MFAHQAALALVGGQGMPVGSLYLQADTGLGKSHLSQAVGWSLLGASREQRILYITAEEFTNQMISSIKTGQTETFRSRFRKSCDAPNPGTRSSSFPARRRPRPSWVTPWTT